MEDNLKEVGRIKAMFRYPVKSMHGHQLNEVLLTENGFAGDRRLAFVRADNNSNFPWLTGRQIHDMLRYEPYFTDPARPLDSPIRVKTLDQQDFAVDSRELLTLLEEEYPKGAYLSPLEHGLFDDSPISIISTATVENIGGQTELELDPRRFRPNLLVETVSGEPFEEENWLGSVLQFGDRPDSPQVWLASQNVRCMMITLDPDTAQETPRILLEVARSRKNKLGIYGSTLKTGQVREGDTIYLLPAHRSE